MKALTLTQPWATLVILGEKHYETRSWSTRYRGPLVIHASKTFPKWARELSLSPPFLGALTRVVHPLPLGAIIGCVTVLDCLPTEHVRAALSSQELAFGDFSPGRWAWILGDPVPYDNPIHARGALAVWDWQP